MVADTTESLQLCLVKFNWAKLFGIVPYMDVKLGGQPEVRNIDQGFILCPQVMTQ